MDTPRLAKFDPKPDLKLLYLARHVNEDVMTAPASSGQYPRYHREILSILRSFGLSVQTSDNPDSLFQMIAETDYVFSLMNRIPMRNGEVFVSTICEYLKKPYLGACPAVRAIAEDKHMSKHLAASIGVETAPWIVCGAGLPQISEQPFDGPYFVKPRTGAASEYISQASLQATWDGAITQANSLINLGVDVLIERFIEGQNITVPILGGERFQVLPPVILETNETNEILTYEEKLQLNGKLSFSTLENRDAGLTVKKLASSLFSEISPVDYARIDFRYNNNESSFSFLEINICCDISSFGSFMFSANRASLTQESVIEHILSCSLKRQ